MMKKINVENPFFEFMGTLADLVLLNLMFLLCCLPVVTIGASLAALYQSCEDMAEGCFVSAFRNFSGAFKKNLKRSIKVWLIVLFTGCLLIFDLIFLGGAGGSEWRLVGVGVGCLFVLWEMIFCYIFPVFIKKGGTAGEMVKGSLFLAVRNFPYTLAMAVLNVVPLACFLLGGRILAAVVPLYVIFGFGLTAFVNTFFLRRCVQAAGTVNDR